MDKLPNPFADLGSAAEYVRGFDPRLFMADITENDQLPLFISDPSREFLMGCPGMADVVAILDRC